MSSPAKKAFAQRFYNEVFNKGNLDAIGEFVSQDCIDHEEMPKDITGTAGEKLKQFVTLWRRGFPNATLTVEDLICEGDKVVARITFRGTQSGDFMGIPATDKDVSFMAIDIMRVVNDKVVEHWGVSDIASMMQQLGVMPAPQATPV